MKTYCFVRGVIICMGIIFTNDVLGGVSFDQVVCAAIKTWTHVDTASAIAQADRNYLDDTVACAHLDLYALLHTFSQSSARDLLSDHEMLQMRVLLYAIARSNFKLFETSLSDESACVRVVMKKMMRMWDDMSNNQDNPRDSLSGVSVEHIVKSVDC